MSRNTYVSCTFHPFPNDIFITLFHPINPVSQNSDSFLSCFENYNQTLILQNHCQLLSNITKHHLCRLAPLLGILSLSSKFLSFQCESGNKVYTQLIKAISHAPWTVKPDFLSVWAWETTLTGPCYWSQKYLHTSKTDQENTFRPSWFLNWSI